MQMNTGICPLATVAVREKPSHKSEMINQLLFGDSLRILDRFDSWYLIESTGDHYQGWVDKDQILTLPKDEFEALNGAEPVYLHNNCCKAKLNGTNLMLSAGSSLPFYQNNRFKIGMSEGELPEDCAVISGKQTADSVIGSAMQYLGTPYLWGGRSAFGLDCSGFTQIVFKINGYQLPRDSSQQSGMGENIDFVHEAFPGDLVFFENEEQQIVHVGILLNENQIIHASGQVRIDTIDHEGIFNKEKQKYTHKLRLIKRILTKEN